MDGMGVDVTENPNALILIAVLSTEMFYCYLNLDPVVGIALGLIDRTGPLGRQLGVFDLLDPFVTDLGQPTLEGLSLGRGDRLDDAENAFGVGAINPLFFSGGLDPKGGDNLSPPLG